MSEFIYTSNGEPLANERGEILLARAGEIVRCRDCKHGYKADLSGNWYECMKPDGNGDYARWEVEHDGFCAWGTKTEFVTCKCGEELERLGRVQTCPACGRRVIA